MLGLVTKDFLVFKMRFNLLYRLITVLVLCGTVFLFPNEGIRYIALMLPMMGVAFLTDIIKVEEKSDWKDYLPALPITSHEIVLSRYVFCGLLLIALSAIGFSLCAIASLIGNFALGTIIPEYITGIWFAILMICFGIPGGYFFKNEWCTEAMIVACVIVGIIRNSNADMLFFSTSTPLSMIAAFLTTVLLVYVSYRISLWIFSVKRHQSKKSKVVQS